ncbi:MAG: hypothetical protein ACOYWZ_20205 [Bacillota bacterium]
MPYALGIDYGRIARLADIYRSQYGVDPPTSVIQTWMAKETVPAYESHISETTSAVQTEEIKRNIELARERLDIETEQLKQQKGLVGAQVIGSGIGLIGTGIRAYPLLRGLLAPTTPTTLMATPTTLTSPAIAAASSLGLKGIPALVAPGAEASLAAGTEAAAGATAATGGTALPVIGAGLIIMGLIAALEKLFK